MLTSADLTITKDDGVTEITAGDGVTYSYTITVTNGGLSDADNVTVSDIWPAGFDQETVTPSQGSVTSVGTDSFTANLGTIAAGGSATITVTYTVPSSTQAGNYTNTVSVASDEPDPVTSDDTDSDTNTVVTSADLAITKDDGVTQITAGDGVTYSYTITVTNGGLSDADNVTVSDTWPAGFDQGTVTPSQGSVTSVGTDSFTANLGTIVAGGSATITVTYTVPSSTQGGSYTNTVSVASDETDPVANNNTDDDVNTVITSADLVIIKNDGVTTVTAGDGDYTYTIPVTTRSLRCRQCDRQ